MTRRIISSFGPAAHVANALRRLSYGVGSVATGCAIMVGASAPAHADEYNRKITLRCNESRHIATNEISSTNVIGMPVGGNAIAWATFSMSSMKTPGTVSTDGGVEVNAGSQEGTATIVYVVKDPEGRRSTVTLDVTVECPSSQLTPTSLGGGDSDSHKSRAKKKKGPQKTPKPRKKKPRKKTPHATLRLPHLPGSPTHRLTGCAACQPIVAELNALIDKFAKEWLVSEAGPRPGSLIGPRSAMDDYKKYLRLLSELDECEKRCPPAQTATSPIEPPRVVIVGQPAATPAPQPPLAAPPAPMSPTGGMPRHTFPPTGYRTPAQQPAQTPPPAPASPSGVTGLDPSTFPLIGRRTPAQEPAPTPTPAAPSGVTGLNPSTFPLIGRFGRPEQHGTQTQGGQTGGTRVDSVPHAVEQRSVQSGAGDNRSARQPVTESRTSSRMPSAPHNAASHVANVTRRFTTNAVGAPHVTARPAGFAATRFTPSAASHFGPIGPARLGGSSGFSGARVGGFSGAHFARR